MLTRRTNLLLSEPDYQKLNRLAGRQGVSVGELIRRAVKKTYQSGGVSKRRQVLRKIDQLASQVETKGIDYKQLVEDGRKY
jgi:site-specific recombinase